MLSSLKLIYILIILLGSTGTIKEVKAQGPIRFIFNLIQEFFGITPPPASSSVEKPANSTTSVAVNTSKTITNNNQPSTITVTKTQETLITKIKTEVTVVPPQTLTETIRLKDCVRTLTDDTNVTETIPDIDSNSSAILTEALDAQVITQTNTEKTITVTETKVEATTVTSIQITTLCEDKSRDIVGNESCDICLRRDELDDLFEGIDGGDVLRTRLMSKKGTSTIKAHVVLERRPEIESTFTAEN